MIKYPLNNNQVGSLTKRLITQGYDYPVNPYGTEEVLISSGCSPILSIYYGNEVQEDANFVFRPTKGELDLDISPIAKFEKISGNTVNYNQLVQSGNFVDSNKIHEINCSLSISNNICTLTKTDTSTWATISFNGQTWIIDHKYFLKASVKFTEISNGTVSLRDPRMSSNKYSFEGINTDWQTGAILYTCKEDDIVTGYTLCVLVGSAVSASIQLKNLICIDLTQMFGASDADIVAALGLTDASEIITDAGVAAFEKYLENNLGKKEYYPYSAGELIPVKMTGLKTAGFNQWDEEWEVGGLNSTTGQTEPENNRIRSKNYNTCFPNTSYNIKKPSEVSIFIYWYDTNKVFISRNATSLQTSPSNAYYFKIMTYGGNYTTYNNNICINLSDTSKNGTYEPYQSTTRYLDVTTLKGKLDVEGGSSTSVVIFPDGMKKVGSVKDEIINDNGVWKAIKRVGSVDLGSFTWTKNTNNPHFHVRYDNIKYNTLNMICKKGYKPAAHSSETIVDGEICATNSQEYLILRIKDSTYSSSTEEQFKTAMSGVILYYELATPLTYILDDNSKEVKKIYQCTNLIYQVTSNLADTSQA